MDDFSGDASVSKFACLLACAVLVSQPAWAALPFTTTTVNYQMTDTGYSTEATVEAVKQSTVAAQVSGRVAAVKIEAGDYVKAGTENERQTAQKKTTAATVDC